MDPVTKKWMLPAGGAAAVILTLWGIFGGGTALTVLPEPEKKEGPAVLEKDSSIVHEGNKGGVKKYDAALYLRSRPLRDPFHAENMGILSKNQGAATEAKRGMPAEIKENYQESTRGYPVLQGIMQYGENKLAMVEVDGKSETVREGDKVSSWSVVAIQDKSVSLAGESGMLLLTMP